MRPTSPAELIESSNLQTSSMKICRSCCGFFASRSTARILRRDAISDRSVILMAREYGIAVHPSEYVTQSGDTSCLSEDFKLCYGTKNSSYSYLGEPETC